MAADELTGASFVVTGGTGFLGSAFVRYAVRNGATVTIVARQAADHWRLQDVAGRYATVVSTLADLDRVALPGHTPATMVHFAAAGVSQTLNDVDQLVATNVAGTARALRFAVRTGVSRFVILGSSGEYGAGEGITEGAMLNPTSEYGATRAAATLLARAFGHRTGLAVAVVRPFAVYGPFEAPYRLIPYCILRGLRGKPLRISSGMQTRDYVHVDDVAEGIARVCTSDAAAHGIFNLCTGVQTSVRDAAELVSRLTGGRSRVESGARPPIPGEMWRTSGDATRAREMLGWVPRLDFEKGLTETIDWFRNGGAHLVPYASTPE